MSINSSSKINFYFLLILLYLSIANWQVLVSKYKCTSSNELLAMQLISAGGGISSLSSKKMVLPFGSGGYLCNFASPKGSKGVHLRES